MGWVMKNRRKFLQATMALPLICCLPTVINAVEKQNMVVDKLYTNKILGSHVIFSDKVSPGKNDSVTLVRGFKTRNINNLVKHFMNSKHCTGKYFYVVVDGNGFVFLLNSTEEQYLIDMKTRESILNRR